MVTRPKSGESWTVKVDQIKGIEVSKNVGPFDDYVEGYIHKVGADPETLPEWGRLPLASLGERIE